MMAITSSPPLASLEPLTLAALPSEPLVSILVANYNYEKYIGQTIESVLSQSYRNWELVVVDDGSTDGSVPLIERWVQRDGRIRLLRKPNGGHASALNAAFSNCQGNIICLLDSDDLYLPEKLERVIAAFAARPEVGFLIHRVFRVNEQRQRQGVWPLPDSLPDGWVGPDLLNTGGILPYAPPTSGISLRREVATVLFPLSIASPLHMCPDQVIARLAPLVTSVKRMPEALAEYRLHAANTYSQQQVTLQSVTRELGLSKALWQEQYRFLSCIGPAIPEQLAALDHSPHIALLEYLRARLCQDPAAPQRHAEYLAICKRQGESRWRLFWRMSILLPDMLFYRAINLLLGQGALKQLVARIKQLR
jgi:glycosyltransferase involved in cell wall biosynthesis